LISLWKIPDLEFDFSRESVIIGEEINEAKKKYISSVIGNLSKREQEITYLKFYEDLSASQIAEGYAHFYSLCLQPDGESLRCVGQSEEIFCGLRKTR
jgi:hypothetical protein